MAPGVRLGRCCGLLTMLVLLAVPASAQALTFDAARPETGWVRLTVAEAGDAARVALAEQADGAEEPLGEFEPESGSVLVRHAAQWRCDRVERTFVARATRADGSVEEATATLRTPSCSHRLLLAPRVSDRGRTRRVTLRLIDRWKLGGISARTCVTPPGRGRSCRRTAIAAGRKQATRSYRTRTSGVWRLALKTAWGQSAVKRAYVRPLGRIRLLATGDSMIQIIDSYLRQRLDPRGFSVRSDARVSTGLSKPFLLNWPRHAASQARRLRPDVTVVFIGANDGFPFGEADCCGEAWVDAYAERAQSMMRSYTRRGRGIVYWLALPAPRPEQWRAIYPAVNRALRQAARGFRGQVRVLPLDKVFTPGNRFRSTMAWHGRRLTVRQGDGVHLSSSGASIAEAIIQRALRRDGVL